jgi:uncharacterized protein
MGVLAIGLLALTSGVLIGCISVGGVLLVPGLSLMGVPLHRAVAAAMLAFLFSGVIASWVFARRGSIDWRAVAWLSLGAAPSAFAGAVAGNFLSPVLLGAVIGVAVVFAGWRVLVRRDRDGHRATPSPPALALIGAVVGFPSALTGTSGPMLLVPLLIALDLPILPAVGLSQAIQLPIALTATLGNLAAGAFDLRLTAVVSLGLVLGAWAGARAAHALPLRFLTRLVGVVLLGVGTLLVVRSIAS